MGNQVAEKCTQQNYCAQCVCTSNTLGGGPISLINGLDTGLRTTETDGIQSLLILYIYDLLKKT